MTIGKVKELYEAQPFRPFTVCLADGRKIPVRHKEFVALSPSGRTMIVYQPDDSHDIIDILLVTSLEVRNGRRTSSRN